MDRLRIPALVAGALWVVGGCTCFVAGTPVATPDGPRPIGELGVGAIVETWLDGRIGQRRIRRVHSGRARRLVDLRTGSSGVCGVTPGHRIAVPGGWRLAGELFEGDLVQLRHGVERIVEVMHRSTLSAVVVHNLVLEGDGAFFANGLIADQKREPRPVHGAARVAAAALVLAVACSGANERHRFGTVPSTSADDETTRSESATRDTGWTDGFGKC